MSRYINYVGIAISFGVGSFFISIVYYWGLPYFLNIFLIMIPSWKPYALAISPAPVVILFSAWFYSLGVYYDNKKLITTSETLILISVGVGIILFFIDFWRAW